MVSKNWRQSWRRRCPTDVSTVDVAVLHGGTRPGRAYTYRVPDDLAPHVAPGQLVLVPFGEAFRRGWVLQLGDGGDEGSFKPLARILWNTPLLSADQLALGQHISAKYRGALGPTLQRMLPEGARKADAGSLRLIPGAAMSDASRTAWPDAGSLFTLLEQRRPVSPERVAGVYPDARQRLFVASLLEQGCAEVVAAQRPCPAGHAPSAQAGVGQTTQDDATRHDGDAAPSGTLRTALSAIFTDVANRRGGVFVLHGEPDPVVATLQIARRCESLGLQLLVLMPELRASDDLVASLRARFPAIDGGRQRVAVFHGRMKPADRAAQWRLISEEAPLLLIGSRAAVLAPLPKLGAIVVLDEQSHSYKLDQSPRFHVRDLAVWRARHAHATVALVSRTCDPVTYWRARKGVFHYYDVRKQAEPQARAATWRSTAQRAQPAPPVTPPLCPMIIDLRHELRMSNVTVLSRMLRSALAQTLGAGGQAVLLLNRRGTHTQHICTRCGYVARCRRCSVAMTYHGDADELVCHYCNERQPGTGDCPNCPDRTLRFVGVGTQRVEAELKRAFPQARVGRLDRDSSSNQRDDRRIVKAFASKSLDILVGTQLVVADKLLPPVALAAVLNADLTLHLPDYRAADRTFYLLERMRDRVSPGGRLLVQTYCPDHWVVHAFVAGDQTLFYREELRQRRTLRYPPYAQLVRLLYQHRDSAVCQAKAQELANRLEHKCAELALADATIAGPAPATIERLKGNARWQIFLRGSHLDALLDAVPNGWQIDIDPVSTL